MYVRKVCNLYKRYLQKNRFLIKYFFKVKGAHVYSWFTQSHSYGTSPAMLYEII